MKHRFSFPMKKLIFPPALLIFLLIGAKASLAADIELPNPVNVQTVDAFLQNVSSYLKGVAGFIAVVFIVIGGIMYMVSAGNKEMMERGKRTLLYALGGLAVVFAAPVFYNEIKNIVGGGGVSGPTLAPIAIRTLNLLLSITGTLAIVSLVVGAIWMFTAMGDQDRLELGKKTVIYSIVGIVIVVGSLIIGKQVAAFLGAS